jgi:DNA-binding CsgD family transcriptional regulator
LGARVLADIWFPDAPAEVTGMFARMQRAAATAEMAADLLEMFYRFEVADLLPTIRVPTLVAHRRGSRAIPFELGREMAALIPGAQLAAFEGRAQPIYAVGGEAAAVTVRSFLGDAPRPAAADGPLTEREFEVADLIADGLTNAEIAKRLGLSVRTVDAHVEHIRVKLGMRARTQIAVWARVGSLPAR